ncbi:phosphatase [Intestinimonas butyriciproducens]|uniref:phosphatase n=1 Tax=Intestinimonas butyriciproducens TaxID=1297617 RepID=UPI001956428F|nr:phosphatase [Intestinimonas butyriciproducens]MBM6976424.1 phosphatase [Intestinimonas butyriciproducens]
MAEKLTQAAVEARREYQREWRRKNKDKVKANNHRYWERRAQKEAMAEGRGQ